MSHSVEYDVFNLSFEEAWSWEAWLKENIGLVFNGWYIDIRDNHYYVHFDNNEDATAFRLRFNI